MTLLWFMDGKLFSSAAPLCRFTDTVSHRHRYLKASFNPNLSSHLPSPPPSEYSSTSWSSFWVIRAWEQTSSMHKSHMDIAQTPRTSAFWICLLLAPTLRAFIFGGMRKGGWSAGHSIMWPTMVGKPQEGMGAKLGEENGAPMGDFRRYVNPHRAPFDI